MGRRPRTRPRCTGCMIAPPALTTKLLSTCRNAMWTARISWSLDAVQFRDDERYHRWKFRIASGEPERRRCRIDFRREHPVAGWRFRVRLLPEPRGGGAHGSHDGSAEEVVRRAKTSGRTDGALKSGQLG